MPVVVKIDIEARSVKRGDYLESLSATVTEVDPKPKWTTIHTDKQGGGPTAKKVLSDALVTITRTVDTEEELAARHLASASQATFYAAAEAYNAVKATTAELVEASQYPIDHQWSYLTSHLHALADRTIWQKCVRITGFGRTWAAAVKIVADELADDLLDDRFRARSSSSMSNEIDHAMRERAAKFLRSYAVSEIRNAMPVEEVPSPVYSKV